MSGPEPALQAPPARSARFGAYVIAVVFDAAGRAAFGLGDGTVRLSEADGWHALRVGDGAVLALSRDVRPEGFVCGTDEGRLIRIAADCSVHELATFPGKWVEQVAAYADPKHGLLACATGRSVHLLSADGQRRRDLDHPSTVTGLVFDARGKRIAASHYNGVSLWFTGSTSETPRRLEWKGSHIALAMHPGGDAVVTAMQENALHGWRLADGQHMRMSGYPAKTESLSFSRTGRWLASSGADAVVVWPFFGGGPMGKAPLEIGGGADVLCTRVACHPQHEICAAGFADGAVLIGDMASGQPRPFAPPGGSAISALAWSPDGACLAFGTEDGFAAVAAFSEAER